MKKYIFFIALVFVFASCNNNAAIEKSEIEMAKQTNSINYIIGIGKIIPENDIIQLSSPVNGIIQKIYKKENDSVAVGSIILELEHQLEDEKVIQLGNQLTTQAAQIKLDETNIGELDAKVSNAKIELQRLQNLLLKGAETQQTVDDVSTNLKTLLSNLNKLVATIDVSKNRWQEAKTNLKTAQLERDQKIIKSPKTIG